MKRRITIKYRWWSYDGGDVAQQHEAALAESAETTIHELMEDGFLSGDLNECLMLGDEQIVYRGWWDAGNLVVTESD